MSRWLLDTDALSLFQRQHPALTSRVHAHPPASLFLASITIQEQAQGWLAALNAARSEQHLAETHHLLVRLLVPSWGQFAILPFNEQAIVRFASLRILKLNVGANDSRIASVALEHNLIVVTRNIRDFGRVPGIVTEDWSVPE